jgi:hypothetical protein
MHDDISDALCTPEGMCFSTRPPLFLNIQEKSDYRRGVTLIEVLSTSGVIQIEIKYDQQ